MLTLIQCKKNRELGKCLNLHYCHPQISGDPGSSFKKEGVLTKRETRI